jgi:hypothetical protein
MFLGDTSHWGEGEQLGIPLTQPDVSQGCRVGGAGVHAEASASASSSGTGASRAVQEDRPTKPESAPLAE